MYYLGLDIGGTNIRGALVAFGAHPRLTGTFSFSTPKNKVAFLRALTQHVSLIASNIPLRGIGVGLPGIMHPNGKVLARAPNLPFLNGWDAHAFFKKFHTNIQTVNDARAFLLAESAYGVARDKKNILGIAIGTGIGGAIMTDGVLYKGAHDSAGEVGHIILGVSSKWNVVSNKSFERLAAKKAFLKLGDRSALIGIGVANLVNILDPEIVVLGGGAAAKNGVKLARVRAVAKKHIVAPFAKRTPIVRGGLGEYAAVIGAALYCKNL